MKKLLLIVLLPLAGCAVPTTGVQPLSDGLYKVAHQGSGAWVTTDSLKTEATKDANGYCGKTNKQVAAILGATERTIKAHRHRVMEKMEVQSLAELVSVAERAGILRDLSGTGQPH